MDTRSFSMSWMTARWHEIHWTWPKSKLTNLYCRAQLVGMDPFEFYFSEYYNPVSAAEYVSKATTMTKDQYYRHDAAVDRNKARKREAYKAKHNDKLYLLEKALARKQHDKMIGEICSYALTHGWEPSQLEDLLEPGEQLPWMYQSQQMDQSAIRLEPGQPSMF